MGKIVNYKIPLIDGSAECLFIDHCFVVHSNLLTFTAMSSLIVDSVQEQGFSDIHKEIMLFDTLSLVSLMILSYSISLHIKCKLIIAMALLAYIAFSQLDDSRIVPSYEKLHSHYLCRLSNLVARSRLAFSLLLLLLLMVVFNQTMVIECLLSQREEINRFRFDETCDRVRFVQ